MTVDVDVEEVRVALALNGGVSLAVWMGGCTVELDRARRAAAEPPGAVYGALCRAFRRELVIDVMTGSSAGGINGALLGAAIVRQGMLDPGAIRRRWVRLGDLRSLLHPLSEGRPGSLMRGARFAELLEETFRDVLASGPGGGTAPALDITATDLTGTPRDFRDDWGGTLYAREHRVRFAFREPGDYTAPRLARAARATASFPFAFEPWPVGDPHDPDDPGALAGLTSRRWTIDGGLLDNAPIKAALELVPRRPASRQVKRYLCYVNGDPAGAPVPGAGPPPAPSAGGVLGAIVGLPRAAPFADHLRALQDLGRRTRSELDLELALLETPLEALEAAAGTLLPVYRRRRRLLALRDFLPEPGDAARADRRLEDAGRELPFVPTVVGVPAEGRWTYGHMSVVRVGHLALDLIRTALPQSTPEDRLRLLHARRQIDERIAGVRRALVERGDEIASEMRSIAAGESLDDALHALSTSTARQAWLRGEVAWVGSQLDGLLDVLRTPGGREVGSTLFGTGDVPGDRAQHFLRRILAMEIVRRAFAADEAEGDGQVVAFAQMTPEAPPLIFSSTPLSAPPTATAKDKLCGLYVAHFSGFLRAGWRANDFMWGRLDAAARIAELLVDTVRPETLARTDREQVWTTLTAELMALGPEQRALVAEALDDHGVPAGRDDEDRLHRALQDDLMLGDGRLTRTVAARAAQFEVLCQELPALVATAREDGLEGASPDELGIDAASLRNPAGVLRATRSLRATLPAQGFPARLGVGRGELGTDLGVRTLTQAGLVAVALARAAGNRATLPLVPLRALLLPAAGAVSRGAATRLAVVAAYWAAAVYLVGRVVTTDPSRAADLGGVRMGELGLGLVAWMVVAGSVLVPAVRTWLGRGRLRAVHAAACAGLALAGGLAASGLALSFGDLSPAQLLVGAGAPDPPVAVAAIPLVLGLGLVVVPGLARRFLSRLRDATWQGTASLVVTFAGAGIVGAWSALELVVGGDGATWKTVSLTGAVIGAPLVAGVYLFALPMVRARSRPSRAVR